MNTREIHIVTGAYGFSGKYITGRLLAAGHQVRTLTNSTHRENPFHGRVTAYPYHFTDRAKLIGSLQGASVLYNNYWVRFNHRNFSYAQAVENSLSLFDAAKQAGIKRIVHISITNPTLDSPYEYFSGKAQLEQVIIGSGLSYAILRPAVLFGKEDILINNIAWFLRRFPAFGVFGDGKYRLQPIFVDDLAALAVEQGKRTENVILDAIGPETFTYRGLAEEIGKAIGKKRPVLPVPPVQGYMLGKLVGLFHHDVTITADEIRGLMAGLLYTDAPPLGTTKLTDWLKNNASSVGKHYSNELKRRRDRERPYEVL
ncbi:MAG: SDR family oxidoreductase [Nitrospirota bacterium]